MDKPYWYPLYEMSADLGVPLIVHPSHSKDPRLDPIPHSYQYNNVTEEYLAMLLLENSDVFDRFPGLHIVVCHCGGALRRILERAPASGERGGGSMNMPIAQAERTEARDTTGNLWVDSCAYDQSFLRAAIEQYGVAQMVFGTEVPGSGSAHLNVNTNRPTDDLIAVLEQFEFLTDDDRKHLLHDNLLEAFPRLAKSAALA